MRTKSNTIDSISKELAKYSTLIDEALREVKRCHEDGARWRAEMDRLRTSTRRKKTELREILRRVDATL